jgi:hypothetical protein
VSGLAQALRQATASRPALLNEAATLLLGHAQGEADDFEWQQTESELWPVKRAVMQRIEMVPGEVGAPLPEAPAKPRLLNLAQVAGETGAAALPLQLAVACEQLRFEAHLARFGHPFPRSVLVAETGDYPVRGALCMQPAEMAGDSAPESEKQGNQAKES